MEQKFKIFGREWLALVFITIVVFSSSYIFSAVFGVARGLVSLVVSGGTNVTKVAEVDISDYVSFENPEALGDAESVQTAKLAKDVFRIDDNILIHASGRLLAFDKTGKNIWNRDIRSDKADILKWNDKTVIVDKFRGDVVVINTENLVVKSVSDIGQVEKVKVSNEKLFVKLLGENIIDVYSLELEKVARIDDDYGSLIDFVVDAESSELLIYTVSIREEKLKSFLYVYNQNAELIGSSDIESSLVFDMIIEDNINIICDDKLITFTKDANPISEFKYSGSVDDVIAKGSKLYGIFSKGTTAEFKRSLKLLDEMLKEERSIDIPNNAKGIEAGEDKILVYSDDKITVLDYELDDSNTVNTSIKVENLKWISEEYFYITDNKKVNIYKVY